MNEKLTDAEKESLFKKKARPVKIFLTCLIIFILLFSLCSAGIMLYKNKLLHPTPYSLPAAQAETLTSFLDENYPVTILRDLPYTVQTPDLPIQANSVIIADASNGCILYEKNADQLIPPASMIKLLVMYVVEHAIDEGIIGYDDVVELPPESWACNLPPDSSVMFLSEGQHVTVDELLQGLAVVSGNDAAYALAAYCAGSVDAFVQQMNDVLLEMGLTYTKVVEPSGYSEYNTTTAREFLSFCRKYIYDIPSTLEKYHSLEEFTYPKEENLPDGMKPGQPTGNWLILSSPLTRKNTNKALALIPGADGLKTGYIEESGFNLALTAQRNGTRFVSVTMRGPGANTTEGNRIRAKDGNILMDWAFANFTSVPVSSVSPIAMTVTGAKDISAINLIPARDVYSVTVPHINGITESTLQQDIPLTVTVTVPDHIQAPVLQGKMYGKIEYAVGNTVLQTVPLLADRNVEPSGKIKRHIEEFLLK